MTHTKEFEDNNIELKECTPEEIRDVCVEMDSRLRGEWLSQDGDEELQTRFRDIYPKDILSKQGHKLHGDIKSRFGADFLRDNSWWLD